VPYAQPGPHPVGLRDLTVPGGAALQEAPGDFHCFVAVCAFAGLRLGEAAGLQMRDVDFLRRTLSIQRQIQGQVNSRTVDVSPKYESARTVYLPDDLVTVLAAPREPSAAG
jgi:integrase